MIIYPERNRQSADRAVVTLRSLESLRVQPLLHEFCFTLFAGLLVLLAVSVLAVDAAVLDGAARRGVTELDGFVPALSAVCAGFAVALVHN